MHHTILRIASLLLLCSLALPAAGSEAVRIKTSMPPPSWALLQRELLRANVAACKEFFDKYFDERGYLLCVERWGGNDGPDDAIENCTGWPMLHALGASDEILHLYKKAWEGHLRQYTEAKTTEVPFAKDGMYYKEFPVMFDWLHNTEGLTVFNLQGLSDPNDRNFRQRVRRYAGFYMNEDPDAPNYDPKHKIIRSMFNGSKGPLLRPATALDWAGDPIEVGNRFKPRHGERTYEEFLAHFKDYGDIVGDHPQNLAATTLALNAYMMTGEEKYKAWLLEYVDAWRQRTIDNGGIIPTKIGLDGKIGGPEGKWYGGVYGWAFSVIVPQTGDLAHRNNHHLGLLGFGNAYLLTGDDRYLDVWRQMIKKVNAQGKKIDGQMKYPHMYGDKGWYLYKPEKYDRGALDIWYWSMKEEDRQRLPMTGWLAWLHGKNPDYPEEALRADFARLRQRVAGMRADTTTPDTRLADDPMPFNPASYAALTQLMVGGLPPDRRGTVLHSRLRYFDPVKRRAGVPEDVAALIEKMTADQTVVTLVNVNQLEPRTVILQAGGYGEHQFTSVQTSEVLETSEVLPSRKVDAPLLTVRLEPGSGARLVLGMRRYVNQPTMAQPWDRSER